MDTLSFQGGQSFNVNNGVATGANAAGSSAIQSLTGGNSFSSYVPPNPIQPIPSNSLGQAPLNFPTGNPLDNGSTLVSQAVGGANAANPPPLPGSSTPSLDMVTSGDYTQDPAYQQAQGQLTQSETNYENAANGLPSQANLLSQAEQTTGATTDLSQVNDLKTQLAASTAAYNNQYQQIGTKGVDAGVPAIFYQGEQAAQQRQAAVVTSGLATRLQAAQGNYDTAEALAEKTASLQFSDAQAKIDNLKSFIDLNQNNLSQAEKVAVSKMQAQATQQQKTLDTQKAAVSFALTNNITQPFYNVGGTIYRTSDGKAYSTPAAFFADGGAKDFSNAQVVSAANTAEKDSVVQLANKYPDANIALNDSLGAAQQKVENSSKIYQNSVRLLGGSSGGSGGGVGGGLGSGDASAIDVSSIQDKNASNSAWGGLSFNALEQDAKLFLAQNGKMPSLGLGSSAQTQAKRNAIQNYAGQLADSMGMDVNQISALYKSNSKAAGGIIDRVAKIDTTAATLTSQFPRLAQLANSVGSLGITESDLTAGKAAASRKFGSVDAGNYIELIQTIRGDYAAMQAALAGGKGGQYFAQSAKDAIPLGLTSDQYMGLADTIQASAMNAKTAAASEANDLIMGTSTSTDQTKPNFMVANGQRYALGPDGTYYPQ